MLHDDGVEADWHWTELNIYDWSMNACERMGIKFDLLTLLLALNHWHMFRSRRSLLTWKDYFDKCVIKEMEEGCLKEPYDNNTWDYEPHTQAGESY